MRLDGDGNEPPNKKKKTPKAAPLAVKRLYDTICPFSLDNWITIAL